MLDGFQDTSTTDRNSFTQPTSIMAMMMTVKERMMMMMVKERMMMMVKERMMMMVKERMMMTVKERMMMMSPLLNQPKWMIVAIMTQQ